MHIKNITPPASRYISRQSTLAYYFKADDDLRNLNRIHYQSPSPLHPTNPTIPQPPCISLEDRSFSYFFIHYLPELARNICATLI